MAEHRVEMAMSRAAAPCRIWIPQPNSTRGATAHAGYYHRFSLFKPVSRSYHTAPTPSDNGSDDVDDRTRDDAGHCALGWPRWQLPDGTTIVQDQSQLEYAAMDGDSSPSVGSRRCDRDGR